MEVDLRPCQVPPEGPSVGRPWKVREEAGKTKRPFSGFEAERGKTPHQSRFGRDRAFANEALQGEPVRLAPAAAKRVDASRRALEKVVAKGTLAYGIKTGFGELANVAISDADVRALQLNLLRSHAIGQGPPLRKDEVRAALLLRANTLAMGYSGVRRILVTRLLEFLNRGVHPVIPSRGSR